MLPVLPPQATRDSPMTMVVSFEQMHIAKPCPRVPRLSGSRKRHAGAPQTALSVPTLPKRRHRGRFARSQGTSKHVTIDSSQHVAIGSTIRGASSPVVHRLNAALRFRTMTTALLQ